MKKVLLTSFVLASALFWTALDNPEAYKEAMTEQINQLQKAESIMDLQASANAFLRISKMHSEEWLPLYYASLSYANIGYRSEGDVSKIDAWFDEAEKYADQAMELSKNNAELVALKGYILMGKLNASPATRGQSLSPRVMGTFQKALHMDEDNPRALILLARMQYGMAQFMGQKPTEACGMVSQAQQLFTKEASGRSDSNTLMPAWGSDMAEQMEGACGDSGK